MREVQKQKEKESARTLERILKHIKDGIISSNIGYKDAFNKFDIDGNKKIDHQEFK